MNIGVNSRLLSGPKTGIYVYIKEQYFNMVNIDKKNKYYFFQTASPEIFENTAVCKIYNILNNFIPFTLINIFFDLFGVVYLISKYDIKVFHAPAHVLPFYKKKGVKYIVTCHDLAFIKYPKQYGLFFRTYYRYVVKHSLSIADQIIAVSKSTKKDIVDIYNIDSSKIHVVYSGIEKSFFIKQKKQRLIDDPYFLTITTHPRRKNTFGIFRAMVKNNNATFKKMKLIIVGYMKKAYVEEINNQINELKLNGRVVVFGFASKNELISLYQNANFFIYPSFYEGFGFPVVEAMATKCPVITSNNSSLKEIMPDDRFLVDPKNIDDISQKISKILSLPNNEKEFLVKKNYKFAKQFAWQKASNEITKIINAV